MYAMSDVPNYRDAAVPQISILDHLGIDCREDNIVSEEKYRMLMHTQIIEPGPICAPKPMFGSILQNARHLLSLHYINNREEEVGFCRLNYIIDITLITPWRVFYGGANIATFGADTVITDDRLRGKTGYRVVSTDFNFEFEPYDGITGNLIYQPGFGVLVIKNYALTAGRHITIWA